jgi:hypothetical protein
MKVSGQLYTPAALETRPGEPQSRSGCCGEKSVGDGTPILDRPGSSLLTTPTEAPGVHGNTLRYYVTSNFRIVAGRLILLG